MHIVPFFCMCLFIIDRLWVRKNAIGLLFIKIFFFCGCVDHHFVWMCLFYYRHWLPLCWFYKIYFFRWLSEHICNQICNHLLLPEQIEYLLHFFLTHLTWSSFLFISLQSIVIGSCFFSNTHGTCLYEQGAFGEWIFDFFCFVCASISC